ncbi:MAG: helix-turn-helix domain-containing protein [Clostridiaceae bacterium]|nr:helix-turn-helix domain-containing protein [Clostridiaceae bacterium]
MKNRYLLSISEAAKRFGIGRDRLYELCYTDKTVPTIKIGQYTKINVPMMEEWLDKATKEGRQL